MERTSGKITKIFIIINILLTLTILYFSYLKYQNYQKEIIEKEKITKEYQELMKDDTLSEEEIDKLNKNIQELQNIDETIKNTKEEVFKLASQLEQKIQKKETNMKIAYLTFDDGPYYNTYKVLDILKKNKVKATFFTTNVNGTYCYDNKKYECHKLYQEYAKANHTIANHTYTHGWNRGLYKNADSFISAVKKQEDLVKKYTGITTNIVRFPGGSGTPSKSKLPSMIQKLRDNGYGWVDWSAQDGDGKSVSSTKEGWKIFTGSINEDIEVVLFHDYHWVTTSILPDVIKYLRDNNYILLPLFYESVTINK